MVALSGHLQKLKQELRQNLERSLAIPPGRKFQGERTYKPKKDFAYGMRAGPPTSALAKQSFWAHQAAAVQFGGGVLVVAGVMWGDVR